MKTIIQGKRAWLVAVLSTATLWGCAADAIGEEGDKSGDDLPYEVSELPLRVEGVFEYTDRRTEYEPVLVEREVALEFDKTYRWTLTFAGLEESHETLTTESSLEYRREWLEESDVSAEVCVNPYLGTHHCSPVLRVGLGRYFFEGIHETAKWSESAVGETVGHSIQVWPSEDAAWRSDSYVLTFEEEDPRVR